jgi:hypothetical protein
MKYLQIIMVRNTSTIFHFYYLEHNLILVIDSFNLKLKFVFCIFFPDKYIWSYVFFKVFVIY